MARFDVHAPSRITPEDYVFVSFQFLPSEGDILGNAEFLLEERKRLRAHMDRTGGKWSGHGNGGCGVCGSTNMIYSAAFYHEKTNTYLRVGTHACAGHLEMGDVEAFRRKVTSALEAGKGVRKAQAILEKAGLSAAWALREADAAKRAAYAEECRLFEESGEEPEIVADKSGYGAVQVNGPKFTFPSQDETTVLDMVSRLVKYGDISPKAMNFMGVLLDRIQNAGRRAEERAAEAAAASPVPTFTGRTMVRGEVLTVKTQEGVYGVQTKVLIKVSDGGWKLWSTLPASISDAKRGDVVEFQAAIQKSRDDDKFAFASRPSKARIVSKAKEAA